MVEISDLQVGMRVKVVDEWPPDGRCYEVRDMDRWLGDVVTVKRILDTYVTIEESALEWAWNKNCFDYIVDEEEFEPPNMGDILSLFGGDAGG